ncbi:MAG: ABC transporter substrate binding protein, partial [Spirochaetota bacterium]
YSDAVSIETFFQYIKTLMPRLSLLGQIESMGEPDSRYITGVIRYRAAIADIDSTKTSIMRNIRQIPDAVNALVSKGEKVEVLYLANSSYLFRNLDTVVKIANRNSVPVVSSDPISAAGSGVIFAYGPNYAKLAEATADLIIQFLGAESEAQQQDLFAEKVRVIEGDDAAQVYVDAAAAAQFGITIPPEILALSRNLSESPQ